MLQLARMKRIRKERRRGKDSFRSNDREIRLFRRSSDMSAKWSLVSTA